MQMALVSCLAVIFSVVAARWNSEPMGATYKTALETQPEKCNFSALPEMHPAVPPRLLYGRDVSSRHSVPPPRIS